ncbi:MAG TPA: substrate-binding domain-containing protein [Amycolatopsis sp.]|nr:substrate-binding domain-containing protein [Amycolatopsis sp.]
MKIMRPLSAVGIVASAALVLAACGTDPGASSSSSSSASVPAATGTADVNCGGKSPLSAEGSTAQKNAIDIFTQQYGKKCSGQKVNYNASGSGAGVKQFNAAQTDFSGSDSPMTGADLDAGAKRCGAPAWNIPMVVGPIAVAYKLSGVDKLALTPTVIAKIFNGGVGNGAQGSNGVASTVKGADGAITYVEGAFAKDGLTPALIDSGSGGVELSATAVAKSLDAAKFLKDGTNDLALDLNGIYSSNVAGAYPLLLVTYEIVCSKYSDAQVSQAVKAFLTVAATYGEAPLSAKGNVPLAQSLQTKVLAAIKAIS